MVSVDLLKKLSQLRGVSGYEERFSDEIVDIFSEYCDEVSKDNLGNVIGVKKSSALNAKK